MINIIIVKIIKNLMFIRGKKKFIIKIRRGKLIIKLENIIKKWN